MLDQEENKLKKDLAQVVRLLHEERSSSIAYGEDYANLLDNHGKLIRATLTLIFSYAAEVQEHGSNDFRRPDESQDTKMTADEEGRVESLPSMASSVEEDESGKRIGRHARTLIGATAIEMLHLATLAHDDVIDNAPVRRGKPTVQTLDGNKAAIYLGDLLLSRYMEVMATVAPDTGFLVQQAHDVNEIVAGDLFQSSLAHDCSVTIEDYERAIRGKTATLFRLACTTGTILAVGRSDSSCIDRAAAIGEELGMAYQIIDDIDDFDLTQKSDKPKLEDITSGIYTLPVILALRDDPGFEALLIKDKPDLILEYFSRHPDYMLASKNEVKKHLDHAQALCNGDATPPLPQGPRTLLLRIIDKLRSAV